MKTTNNKEETKTTKMMVSRGKYRNILPELFEKYKFIGEAGLETTLLFDEKVELPYFASFVIAMKDEKLIEKWQTIFYENAKKYSCGYWLDTKTWRANPDWGEKLGIVNLDTVWETSVNSGLEFRERHETEKTPIIVSGVIGPRRDGYRLLVDDNLKLTIDDAKQYHKRQIDAFVRLGVDVISVYTMNHFEEAAGISLAAKEAKIPVVISFTVETDGKLVSGDTLASVVKRIDEVSEQYPLFYMINCAHPTHMKGALSDKYLCSRLGGLFPNSSKKSHAELDESTELDRGDSNAIGGELMSLCKEFHISPRVVGGCCGTNIDHVNCIGKTVFFSSDT